MIFAGLLFAIGMIALEACRLYLPGIGVIMQRCPGSDGRPATAGNENGRLWRTLNELRLTAVQAPACGASTTDIPLSLPEIEKAEQVVVILDTSGSMSSNKVTLPVDRKLAERRASLLDRIKSMQEESQLPGADRPALAQAAEELKAQLRVLQTLPGANTITKSRFDVAKDAIRPLIDTSIERLPINLWGFGKCTGTSRHIYPDGDQTIGEVLDSLITGAESSLARALINIPDMIESGAGQSRDRAVNILLFADGGDGCDQDACAVAADLKRRLPYTFVHVVSIGGDRELLQQLRASKSAGQLQSGDSSTLKALETLKCIADTTGGAWLAGENAAAIEQFASEVVRRSQ